MCRAELPKGTQPSVSYVSYVLPAVPEPTGRDARGPPREIPRIMPTSEPPLLTTLRRTLVALLAFSCAGTLVELLLLEHWDGWQQWVPLVLLGVGVVVTLAFLARPVRTLLGAVRGLAVAMAVAGAMGVWFHYDGNAAFERESTPDIRGMPLFTAAITGATPVLAPGTMVTFALLGLIALHRHPAGARRAADATS